MVRFRVTFALLVLGATALFLAGSAAAKTEGPPCPGCKDAGPALVGTLTLKPDALFDFSGTCKGVKVEAENQLGGHVLSTVQAIDLVDHQTGFEFVWLIPGGSVPEGLQACYNVDGFTGLVLVFKSVSNFKETLVGVNRVLVTADVVVLRRTLI